MNQVLEIIRLRRSVRSFKPEPVPRELLRQLPQVAVWALSAGNLQPWEFYIITDQETRKKVGNAAGQRFVGEAPAVIVVCARPQQSSAVYGERGEKLYCLQDTAAAIQNILLAAASLGLSSCWVGAFREERVIEALNLRGSRPVALLPVGYASSEPKAPPRRPVEEVTRWV